MSRNLTDWRREISTDFSAIKSQLLVPDEELKPIQFAVMLKEVRRMESDVYRMAKVAGFSREDVDNIGPL